MKLEICRFSLTLFSFGRILNYIQFLYWYTKKTKEKVSWRNTCIRKSILYLDNAFSISSIGVWLLLHVLSYKHGLWWCVYSRITFHFLNHTLFSIKSTTSVYNDCNVLYFFSQQQINRFALIHHSAKQFIPILSPQNTYFNHCSMHTHFTCITFRIFSWNISQNL